jgi:hypothetical protein
MTTPPLTATATVATPAADRYAKQLASHLGRRAEVREEADGVRIVIGDGSCLLECGTALVLRATAPTAESLARVQDVVGRHRERFGARNELVVSWA